MQNHEPGLTPRPMMWRWFFAFVAATLPVLFGLDQVMLFFREGFPEMYWSRTLPAGLGVLFAIAGVGLPVTLLCKLVALLRLSRSRERGRELPGADEGR